MGTESKRKASNENLSLWDLQQLRTAREKLFILVKLN